MYRKGGELFSLREDHMAIVGSYLATPMIVVSGDEG
jgi:hypothetical protein